MARDRLVSKTRLRLMRLHSPRLQMFLIVALTVTSGLLASASLLDIGLEAIRLRGVCGRAVQCAVGGQATLRTLSAAP